MKATLSWINDYVDIKDISVKEFVDRMTVTGSKVERIESLGEDIQKVVTGKILKLDKHPDADRLQVSKVDVGDEVLQIVTGATNISVGDVVPIAKVGATLPGGVRINKGKLRGVESLGMMCSIGELGLSKEDYKDACEDGIFILNQNLPLGIDVKKILGLDETVIEFEITSNRVDCFSVLGLAREAAVAFDKVLEKPMINFTEVSEKASDVMSVDVLNTEYCKRYALRVIKNVTVSESPKWIKDRLKGAGIRPINNIVDVTNFVMLELGQPMHAFDLAKIDSNKIIVRDADPGEKIVTLDEVERTLDADTLVIADNEKALAIAGIMGGEYSGISSDTKDIVLECANFDGAKIRLASKKLGLRSDSSALFEKGLNIDNVLLAMDRATMLIADVAGGEILSGVLDSNDVPVVTKSMNIDCDRINRLLGTNIPDEQMFYILEKLEFAVDREAMRVTVPSFRSDIEGIADLAEEVARIYGYNNIKSTLLESVSPTVGGKNKSQKVEDRIKEVLLANGLYETLTYTFTGPKVFDKLNLDKDSKLRDVITISNPLGEDYSVMRTTPVPEMLESIGINYSKRNEKAHLFEVSKVFLWDDEKKSPVEKELVCIGMYEEVDFYVLKGIVEEIFDELKIRNYAFKPCDNCKIFHPGRCANVFINGQLVGTLGEIHPVVTKNYKCPERTYVAYIEKEKLVKNSVDREEYRKLPKFPAVARDISFKVSKDVMAGSVEDILRQRGGKILESFKLFDVYEGEQVGEGQKSMAYSLAFRASDRTLTDDDIDKSMKKIIDGLQRELKATLRD
ncbi:MAG: phenylalanine--tRNA ligase subunit beta [Clostridiales bacterium]|nr:phenylalanine--tRNA ligase subunit beta [Clostridiales bacterium]